jgi:large subunit ribosomal protein L18
MLNTKDQKRIYRHLRIRKTLHGSSEQPRLCIHRSLKNMSASLVDDVAQKTLITLTTLDKTLKERVKYGGNVQAATILGEAFAQKAKEKGINKVCFDRGGYIYHGRVKAFADAARKGGLEF